jgi:hypothetical protein
VLSVEGEAAWPNHSTTIRGKNESVVDLHIRPVARDGVPTVRISFEVTVASTGQQEEIRPLSQLCRW